MARGLRGYFESPRRRKRALIFALLLAAAATIALLIAFERNTAPPDKKATEKGKPDVAPANPNPVPFTKHERVIVFDIAKRFLDSGVARHHFERSWDLSGPELRSGFTKESWGPDNSTLVPFRYNTVRWRLDHSFPNEVGLDVALYPKPHDKDYPSPMVFEMVVSRYRPGPSERWAVSYWAPAPGSAQVVQANTPPSKIAVGKNSDGGTNQLSSVWLAAPAGIFLLILLIPITIGVRDWRRGKRAQREYEASLPKLSNYSSSSKPS